MSKKQRAILRDWAIDGAGSYYALRGDAYNHPQFEQGERIRTSRLVRVDFVKKTAETQNTIYKLEM